MINMSVIKAFLVSPLKWLRVTVAVIFFIGLVMQQVKRELLIISDVELLHVQLF